MNTGNNVTKNVSILIPFYGKWPVYLDLFLKSCFYNQWMDILFITDLDLPKNSPHNVKKVHVTFSDLKILASEKLETEVALKSYYKACDLKPMYGYLFQNYIKDYLFWGFGDIDLLYGNTKKFLNDYILNNYDVITFRTEWISGSLTLLRNNEYINTLFKKSRDWLKVISTDKHYSFTECASQYKDLINGVSIFDIKGEVMSMTEICKREANEGRLKYYENKIIKESIVKGTYLHFKNGEIKDSEGTEYLLYHYISDKPRSAFRFPKWKLIPDSFYITRTGFYSNASFRFKFFVKIYRLLRQKQALKKNK